MLRRREWDHDRCPVYLGEQETIDHVLQCRNKRARKTWKEEIANLLDHMHTKYTEPFILRIIKDRLLRYPSTRYNKFRYEQVPRKIRIAMEAQDMMGWRAFIIGRMAHSWEDAQHEWLIRDSTRSKGTAQSWSGSTVLGLLRLCRGMWDHRNEILFDSTHEWTVAKRSGWNLRVHHYFD